MKSFVFGSRAIAIAVTASLLTACAGSSPSGAELALMPPKLGLHSHRGHGTSWMSPAAKSIKKLLYVSDWSTNGVFVYDFEKGTLVGNLTGLNSPDGQCVDTKGDVWITSFDNARVVEFAHGGTEPIKTLATNSEPVGCSVDPTTGNLAVAADNAIEVFAHARGKGRSYEGTCFPLWSPGYDNKGDLYVEGLLYGSAKPLSGFTDPLACELSHGGTTLRGLHFSGFIIDYPGGIMWDGKHLTLTDEDYSSANETVIYRVTEDTSGDLTTIGKTILTDDCDGMGVMVAQPFIIGKTVVGGNLRCSRYGSGPKFDYWSYPAGGNPKSSLQSPPAEPEGQSVSVSP